MSETNTDEHWNFLRDNSGGTNLADDQRISLLATCVANQQRFAGFRNTIDIREAQCPECGAPGFNTGMGAWVHTCGAEWLSDGEVCEPCPKAAAP